MTQFCSGQSVGLTKENRLAYIAVGGNLPGPSHRRPVETCRRAVALLDAVPGLRVCGLSRWFLSAPMPPSGQPDYVNGVAAVAVDPPYRHDPAVLLRRLWDIEAACGRTRGAANAARTLDLDIVAVGALVRSAPDPILPHPRAHLRAFVLLPLLDVAPDWMHPTLRRSARSLLAGLPAQPIRPI